MGKFWTNDNHEGMGMGRSVILVLGGLLFGLLVGAASALLYAPKSGKKTRRNLTRSFEDSLSSGQDAIDPVVKRLEKDVSDLRETLEERISKLR